MSSLIELKHVTKKYPLNGQHVPILNAIDLTIQAGELIAIMGPSGAGKSTLMNLLGLLDRPCSGEYHIEGKHIATLSDDALATLRNRHIGFVFQTFCLLPRLTALQNVCLPLQYRGLSAIAAKPAGLKILADMGLSDHVNHYPTQLSGGQQQRVAIARALIGDPKLILADEPTGALDSQTGQSIMDFLIDLNKQAKKTIVIITHDEKISAQCHRIITLQDGCVERDT